ncbi:uncharacterized protein [Drosophila pseudoobscura]|uniref:Uncharacterized protein isoform X2 n=2 Tax=Drosophila pseudoobscura pseudoobscura TaxID=46245 RepID=A0A6I8UKD6_DROPS|nr:uncharacterized protein LOC4817230 isoform X2 [Drosophila pseudoobscura]
MRTYYSAKDMRKYGDLSYESKYLLDPKFMTKRDLQHYYRYYNMNKNRGQFKKIVIVIFCLCVFSYLCVDYNLRTKLLRFRDGFDFVARIEDSYGGKLSRAYFVETTGCRMPHFEVVDDNIAQFIFKPSAYKCNKPLTRTSDSVPGELHLNLNTNELLSHYNISDLSAVSCNYTEVKRKNDWNNTYSPGVSFKLEKVMHLPPEMEFFCLWCYDSTDRCIYKDCHFFAVDKPVQKITTRPGVERVSFNQSKEATSERLSVMILGIDSLSHLNFLRQMRKTAAYIKKNLSHVELWGYNKVGDNTFPNIVPMLSGLDDQELNIACAPKAKQTYDGCSFIWKRYQQAGYKTLFAEDVGRISAFNFNQNGFHKQPTDYYLRPILLEMERTLAYKKDVNVKLCMGGRRTPDVLLEYLTKMVPKMGKDLFFSFLWTVTLTHDYFNFPALLDEAMVTRLRQLQDSGVLNRTVVMLLSDHGLRWGSFRRTYQGMMEERQPLMTMLYPPWMNERYPEAIANLRTNSRRLATPFDVHATMLHLLDMGNLEAEQVLKKADEFNDVDGILPRGISLFLPIPAERTCEQAGIASHWCTCHQRQEIQTNDGRVQRAARYVVRFINNRLKENAQCRTLYLNSILQAFIAAPHHKIVKNISTDYAVDITLRMQTKPGLAVFESTVRMSGYTSVLTGTISRINLYGSQSYCMNDPALKMFCYCHR